MHSLRTLPRRDIALNPFDKLLVFIVDAAAYVKVIHAKNFSSLGWWLGRPRSTCTVCTNSGRLR